jgi:hypothetical protein
MYEFKFIMTNVFVTTNATVLDICCCFQNELGTLNLVIVFLVYRRKHTHVTTKSIKRTDKDMHLRFV